MEQISDVAIVPCTDSKYVATRRMQFSQNGRKRVWDTVAEHNSVSVVMYNTTQKAFVLVKQFRPAVYLNEAQVESTDDGGQTIDVHRYPPARACTYELCAGIVDKDLPLVEIAREEMMEETGYNVPLANIHKMTSYRSGVGISGSHQTIFYAELTDEMRTGKGGGNPEEGELIDVLHVPVDKIGEVMKDEEIAKPSAMLFGLSWYLVKIGRHDLVVQD